MSGQRLVQVSLESFGTFQQVDELHKPWFVAPDDGGPSRMAGRATLPVSSPVHRVRVFGAPFSVRSSESTGVDHIAGIVSLIVKLPVTLASGR